MMTGRARGAVRSLLGRADLGGPNNLAYSHSGVDGEATSPEDATRHIFTGFVGP